MELFIVLFAGFTLAALAPGLYRLLGERMAYVMAALPLGIAVHFGLRLETFAADRPLVARYEWVPSLDLSLSLYVDGLSLLFVLLIAGMGALVAVYARGYMAGHRQFGLFYAYLFAFMASMLGLVMAGNLLTLYVFWELTTLTSFLLIGFEHEKESARKAALQSLIVTSLGGLAMLAGLVLLGIVGQSFEFTSLLSDGDSVREHALYPAILALILIGAFTKSAQFPFHFWLPNAMAAPTPVSAYLHSATMVKAGVYLLARLLPVLGETPEWHIAVTTVGAATMFAGAYLAFFQHQLKAVLAYLTINVLGMLVMLLGIGTRPAVEAAMIYLIAHAFYKGSLFMMAGTVSHETGTLDVGQLGGLRRRMPATCAVAILAALSMAGVIPLFGFIAKELYLEAVWKAPSAAMLLTAVSFIASSFLVASALIVSVRPFFGAIGPHSEEAREGSFALVVMPGLLAFGGVIFGLFPQALAGRLIELTLPSMLQGQSSVELKLWHGVNVPLLLSTGALVLGTIGYLIREPVLRGTSSLLLLGRWGPERWYELALQFVGWIAIHQTRLLQNGHLRRYVIVMLASTVALVGWTLPLVDVSLMWLPPVGIEFAGAVAGGLVLVGAGIVVSSNNGYRAVAALGVVGFSMSWIYAMYGAPDLAMTQVVVEALTVLLFVLAFRKLPAIRSISTTRTRIRDAILASCAGACFTMLVLFVTTLPIEPPISEFFAEESYGQAHGRNVVNTILVDFRALDTMGEATVLAVAAIGVYAVTRLRIGKVANK